MPRQTSEVFSQQVAPALQSRVNEAVATHRGWLEAEWKKLSALLRLKKPVPFDEVLPYFQETLEKRVKLYGRTMGKPAETFAGDAGLVDMLCEQAAFDFIMSLRMSAQEGETCGNALKIASLSHWLNPMDMKRLGGKYGGKVDQNVIKSAALGHSKNPDAFIDWFMDAEQYLLSAVPRAPKINIVHKVLFSHAFETNTKLLELV